MNTQDSSLETLQDIRRMMERSSRFISLSGLSGVSAGVFALVGAYIAHEWLDGYHVKYYNGSGGYEPGDFRILIWRLLFLAGSVLVCSLLFAFYFTWRKSKRNEIPMWGHTSKKLLTNLLIPLITGGFFVLGLLYHDQWLFAAPACLVFYGLALVNASKYTLSDIRYIGLLEIVLGLVNMFWPRYSLYFWALGFGVLHIIYGLIMWWKYDKKPAS
ncbi:MAG TPA: hypothetical protein VMT76_12040 [Puia sp.]|nr:hypothetical protein [Puia sp.]